MHSLQLGICNQLYKPNREKTMKNLVTRYLFPVLIVIYGSRNLNAQEECDPQYSIYNFSIVNGAVFGMNTENKVQMNAVGPLAGVTPKYQSDNSAATGFWGYYLTEPFPPIVTASDGDHDARIEISWILQDDQIGSPITGDLTTIYRNGSLLTTVPITQTTFQDFNVFPGEFYDYEISVENELGFSYSGSDVGFLNPNGLVLGTVKTLNQVPVADVEVRLSPNLGLAVEFDGVSDFVVFDSLTVLPVDSAYTIEGWFRAYPDFTSQTIFATTDIGENANNHYIWIGINESGQLHYTHRSEAGGTMVDEISSLALVNDLEWHHLAAVHDGSNMTLYLDGDPVGNNMNSAPLVASMNLVFGKNSPLADSSYFHGRLDDFRYWTVARNQEEIRLNDQRTLNGEEPGIFAYWKFDENLGEKVFDLTSHNIDGFICGIERTELHAPVYVSGITNEQGQYSIKGIYYGSGTTFTLTPGKETPMGTSLDFDGVDDFINFPFQRLDLTAGYTIEGWFQTAANIDQTLLAAVDPVDDSDHVVVTMINDGTIQYIHGSSIITSSNTFNDEFWHHVAVTHDGSTITLYVDGDVEGSSADPNFITDLSEFVFGRRSPDISDQYFLGKIDEFRFWNSARNEAQVEGTMNQVLNGDENGLMGYWKFNEGFGPLVTDNSIGGFTGDLMNTVDETWVEDIPLDEFFSHYFDIENRQATLNPSNTSVDRVDFVDMSLVAVTGFVQFENTACFAEGVEIMVDGETALPPIHTDATGRFIAEFEPGRSGAIISPVLEGHKFIPSFIELPTLNSPLAGIVFYDTKTNDISGKIVGGSCEFPITPSQGQIEVTISSVSGCIDTIVTPDPMTGEFLVEGLPPIIYNVSVDHPNPAINEFFTGDTVSLQNGNNFINFNYKASPEIKITGIPENECGLKYQDELVDVTVDILVFESYYSNGDTNICPVDSGTIQIVDDMGDAGESEITFVDGTGTYTIPGGGYPNILDGGEHPFQKSLQVIATNSNTGESVSTTEWAYILGNRPRASVFTTSAPEIPIMILRDPPGDESYSFISQETSTSTSFSMGVNTGVGVESYAAVHLGADVTVSAGAWGIPDVDLETTMDITAAMSMNVSAGSYYEQTWSLTTTELFQTSDDNAVVGTGGDVFIGGAMNIAYGVTDILEISDSCGAFVWQDIIMAPNGFETTYIYSESHILGTVIPSLWAIGDTTAAELWQQIIDQNNVLKENAIFRQNYSFDGAAGAFEYSETEETTSSFTIDFEMEIESSVQVEVGATLLGIGASGGVTIGSRMTMGSSTTTENTNTNTVGYVLSDGDPGDFFSVDVLWDGSYGTPVFNTVSGASSCPWEINTAPREGVQLMADQTVAIDVPPDEPAVFSLLLGNTSQTDEDGYFSIQILQDTNPYGAHFSVNGTDFEGEYPIFLLAGQQTPVTLTIDKGPEEYIYDNMLVRLVSDCEFQLWQDRGDATAPIPLSDSLSFSVEFIVPCTEVSIAVPENNWIITGADASDSLWVTIDGYDRFDAEFSHLELQYRTAALGGSSVSGNNGITIASVGVSQGEIGEINENNPTSLSFNPLQLQGTKNIVVNGYLNTSAKSRTVLEEKSNLIASNEHDIRLDEDPSGSSRDNDWFIAQSIPKDSLSEDFILVPWNIHPDIISDGTYELRVRAICDAGLYPGTSQIITGIIDRNPPAVVGLPTPVDGILGPDDLISLTMNENLDCEVINVGAGDILLFNTVTGNSVDFTYTCGGNEIFLEPNIQNQFIENQILRADISNLTDMFGNQRTETVSWEFFVNRNPVEWVGGDISDIVIYDDESFEVTRLLINNGGSPRGFEMLNVPTWMSVSPLSGTITPGGTQTVTISIPDDIASGIYNETILASGTMGDEPLTLDVRILCHEPMWTVSPSQFQYSMNMIGYLYVDEEQSNDTYDMVGAFAEEETLGVANIQYVPNLDAYEVFMTIYSNESQGEDLRFEIWDASGCVNYGFIIEDYSFVANEVLGTLSDPVTFTATNQLVQSRDLPSGWTWFSLNLQSGDMSINNVLTSLNPASGDIVKSQTSFDQYVESVGWVGGLDSLNNTEMYQVKLTNLDSLDLLGFPVNVELTPIAINQGWNWVSYLPQTSIELNQALVSLEPITGDLIKSQFGFAQYLENIGWLGSLTFMNPHLGYLLYSENGGSLIYPAEISVTSSDKNAEDELEPIVPTTIDWIVNATDYQYNMTMTSIFEMSGEELTGAGYTLGAFVEENNNMGVVEVCRGVSQSVYIESLDKTLFFMMIYSNQEDSELLQFKLFDNQSEQIHMVTESSEFSANEVLGDLESPYVLTNHVLGIGDEGFIPDEFSLSQNYPNPFNPVTKFGFGLPETGDVHITIYNLLGEHVRTLVSESRDAGYYLIQWDSKDDYGQQMPSGMYLTVMQSGSFHDVKKIILLK